LICFLSQVDYVIDKDMLENDYVFFNLVSQFDCGFRPFKIRA